MIVLGCNKDNRARAMLIVYNNKGVIVLLWIPNMPSESWV